MVAIHLTHSCIQETHTQAGAPITEIKEMLPFFSVLIRKY
jgi:hypothetical protein